MMRPAAFFVLPVAMLPGGCGEPDRFEPYDNTTEVARFYEGYNEKVLKELKDDLEELAAKLAAMPAEAEEREGLEEALANTRRRLKSPEFFSFASMSDLPGGLEWKTGMEEPEIGSPEARKGGTFNTYFPSLAFPPTIRSIGKNANNGFRAEHWDNIEMGLVGLHPNTMRTIPGIADRWAVAPDGRTVYFHIDEEARWSDRAPVTVEDFFMTFYVCLSEYITGPWYRQYYGEMFENITRYDDRHLSIRLAHLKPQPEHYAGLAPYARHFYREFGPDFEERYAWRPRPTTGAYVIRGEDIVKGRSITLTRVRDWWARDHKYYRYRFNAGRIKYQLVRSDEKAFELFKKGRIDMMELNLPKRWYEQMEIPALFKGYIQKRTFYNVYPRVPRGLYINHSKPFLGNLDVRIGLQHATNWQKVIDFDLRGDASRLDIYNEGYGKFSNSGIRAREFDPARAREYFARAGFRRQGNDGVLRNAAGQRLSFTITYTADPVIEKIVQRLKEEALKAGLEYRLEGMDGTASYEKVMQKKHDLALWGWGTTPPYPRYFEGVHSINAYDPGTRTPRVMTNNISVYANPEADPLAEQVRFAASEEEIKEASWKLEEILHETAFWIPGFKREFYRIGHWRWMRWPEDFNVKVSREAQESYVYWIDSEVKERTREAMQEGASYPEVDVVYDQYRDEP